MVGGRGEDPPLNAKSARVNLRLIKQSCYALLLDLLTSFNQADIIINCSSVMAFDSVAGWGSKNVIVRYSLDRHRQSPNE